MATAPLGGGTIRAESVELTSAPSRLGLCALHDRVIVLGSSAPELLQEFELCGPLQILWRYDPDAFVAEPPADSTEPALV